MQSEPKFQWPKSGQNKVFTGSPDFESRTQDHNFESRTQDHNFLKDSEKSDYPTEASQ
jgi:hypothetical protein